MGFTPVDWLRIAVPDPSLSFLHRKYHYYQQLSNGNIQLLKRYKLSINRFDRGHRGIYIGSNAEGLDGEIVKSIQYALLFPDNRLIPIELTQNY